MELGNSAATIANLRDEERCRHQINTAIEYLTYAAVKNAALPKASTIRTANERPIKAVVPSTLSRTL